MSAHVVRVEYYRVKTAQGETKGRPSDAVLARYHRGRTRWTPNSRGGKTVVTIDVDGFEFTGVSYCSWSDQFEYSAGRKLALARAVGHFQDRLIAEMGVLILETTNAVVAQLAA